MTGLRRRLARHPGLIVLAGLTLAYGLWVTASLAVLRIDSDKVWPQLILRLRGRYGPLSIDASPDTYALKYPLYLVANHLFGLTYRALVFEIAVMNAVLFGSVAASYALLVRYEALPRARWWLVAVVGLWVVTLGDPAGPLTDPTSQPTTTFVHPNERNLELGLAILVLVLAGLLHLGRLGAGWRLPLRMLASTVLAVLAAALCFDDPYNLYLMLLPLAGAAVLRLLQTRSLREVFSRQPLLWYFLAVAVGLYAVAAGVAPHLGLHPYSTAAMGITVLPLNQLGAAFGQTISTIMAAFNGTLFGVPHKPFDFFAALLDGVLALGAVLTCLAMLRGWHRRDSAVRVLLPLAGAAALGVFLFSSSSLVSGHGRYLVALVPIAGVLVPAALTGVARTERGQSAVRVVCVLLALSTVLNIVTSVQKTSSVLAGEDPNRAAYERAKIIHRLGLQKGFAWYWDADVTTYLSGGHQLTLPVRCLHNRLRVYHWLIDESWLTKPATRSYVIFDPASPTFGGCSVRKLTRQFGRPKRTVALPDQQDLLIYNYDISVLLEPRPDPDLP